MTSFSLVLFLIPTTIVILKWSFPDFLKKVKYRLKHHGEKSNIGEDGLPILVLKYNGPKARAVKWASTTVLATIFVMLPWGAFYGAADSAREDMHRTFFFLNREQSYVLYHWTWNILGLFMLWSVSIFIRAFNKSLLFFKSGVILNNRLTGSKKFVLNNDVWLIKSPKQNIYWLYDDLKGIKVQIFNRNLMNLDPRQQELLNEYIGRIPEKKWSKNIF